MTTPANTKTVHVKLAPSLLKRIDARVKRDGYTGRADLIRAAIRRELEED